MWKQETTIYFCGQTAFFSVKQDNSGFLLLGVYSDPGLTIHVWKAFICTVCHPFVTSHPYSFRVSIVGRVIFAGRNDWWVTKTSITLQMSSHKGQIKDDRAHGAAPEASSVNWNTCLLPWFLHVPLQLWIKSIISLLQQTAEQMWSLNAF